MMVSDWTRVRLICTHVDEMAIRDYLAFVRHHYWGGLVIYMAVYNKARFPAERTTAGGEFLSQVWVLLGHMGCGEQSDSAV